MYSLGLAHRTGEIVHRELLLLPDQPQIREDFLRMGKEQYMQGLPDDQGDSCKPVWFHEESSGILVRSHYLLSTTCAMAYLRKNQSDCDRPLEPSRGLASVEIHTVLSRGRTFLDDREVEFWSVAEKRKYPSSIALGRPKGECIAQSLPDIWV